MSASAAQFPGGGSNVVDDAAFEAWFRSKGLPYLVPVRRWGRQLPRRAAPFLLFVALVGPSYQLADIATDPLQTDSEDSFVSVGSVLLLLLALALAYAVPIAIALLARWAIARRPRLATSAALAIVGLLVVGEPVISNGPWGGSFANLYLQGVIENLAVVVVALLLTWLGVGSLAAWVVSSSIRQSTRILRIATRTLPLIAVVVLLSMFSSPLWIVADTIDAGRVGLALLFFLVVGVLFVSTFVWGEVGALDRTLPEGEELAAHLAGTPAEGDAALVSDGGRRFRTAERLNVAATVIVAMALQVAVLCALVFLTLMVFGGIVVPAEVVARLVGHPPEILWLLGISTRIPLPVVTISLVLAGFAGLKFFLQLGTNAAHREPFYEPILRSAREATAVRAVYRARRRAARAARAARRTP